MFSSHGLKLPHELVLQHFPLMSEILCETCETILSSTKKHLDSNETEGKFTGLAKKLCSLTPFKNACEKVILRHGSFALEDLDKYLENKSFCKDLRICTTELRSDAESAPENDEIDSQRIEDAIMESD